MDNEDFHRICGEILRSAQSLESYLFWLISDYFRPVYDYRQPATEDLLLSGISFSRTLDLFKEICKREGIDSNEAKKVSDATKIVIDIRNRVAHADSYVDSATQSFIMYPPKSRRILKKDEAEEINDGLVAEVEKQRQIAVVGIAQIFSLIHERAPSKKM